MFRLPVVSFLLLFVYTVSCTQSESKQCEEKEKSLALLELTKDSITKAKHLVPECEESTNISESNKSSCGKKEKIAAFIDVALELINEAKDNYPECDSISIVPEDKPEEKPEPTEKPEPEEKPEPTEKPEPEETPFSPDCLEILQKGSKVSGVYKIRPRSLAFAGNRTLEVYCDMDTDGGGWTVFQRRGNFTPLENFNRDWNTYRTGFGHVARDFWLGNDNIHILSNQGKNSVRFDLRNTRGGRASAIYRDFRIEDHGTKYKLHISGVSGDAGDTMVRSNGQIFSTADGKCPKSTVGGWWHVEECSYCNPNGLYQPGRGGDAKIACWSEWAYEYRLAFEGLLRIEMKLRRNGPI